MSLFSKVTRAVVTASSLLFATVTFAIAGDGLVVTELPAGGDITVPGDFPVYVPNKNEALFSGINSPQAITLTNTNRDATSVVRIYANHEKSVRTITLKPGSSAVYNFKSSKPVRVKVVSGDVRVRSLQPLKVQR